MGLSYINAGRRTPLGSYINHGKYQERTRQKVKDKKGII
jgi:hypothetical protein